MLTAAVMAAVAAALPAQAPAGLQFADLGKRHLPVDSDQTQVVAYGDVDGDGDLDMVSGNAGWPTQQRDRLYLNDGTGVFTDATASRMPVDRDNTLSLVLGDVDGDGDLDMVLGNYSAQNRLYLNDGTGIFIDATANRMPTHGEATTSLAFGDVDGDGDLDLVIGNAGRPTQQRNRLYLNDGTGSFSDATASRMPNDSDSTESVALGDVDGDGDLDLVLGNWGQNRLYSNDGTGVFTDATASRMPVDSDNTSSAALGDVDGDGDLDMVIGNGSWLTQQQNRLYLNDGTGTFVDATVSQMPVDLDYTKSIALGDVDRDGDLDLVIGNGGQQSRLYLNSGTGSFSDATAIRMPADRSDNRFVMLADVDGDGDHGMLIGNLGVGAQRRPSGQQNRLYINDGAGNFADATASRMPVNSDSTSSVALGDVDGDGDLDMVIGNRRYARVQNRLYLNDGTESFFDATASGLPLDSDQTYSVALGDVDGDGDLDVVIGNGDLPGQQNRLYLNDGAGSFSDATASRMPVNSDNTRSVTLGDVDGDGDLDLVIGNWNEQNRLYLNDGTGSFSDATASRMPVISDDTRSVTLGDVDGDGDLDLVIGNLNDQNRLYLNDGTGSFSDATASRMPPDNDFTSAIALGDVDGDGDLDMVIGNTGRCVYPNCHSNRDRLYLNNGFGSFSDVSASHMPGVVDWTESVALGDIDSDGDLDIVIGIGRDLGRYIRPYVPTQKKRLYLNDGTGVFSDTSAIRLPVDNDFTGSLALGDLDGDGDLDMAIGNFVSPQGSRIYTNLQRQLDAAYLLRPGHRYTLDAYSRYGPPSLFDVALPYLSTTRVSIPAPPYGILGIDLVTPLPPVLIPQPAGVGTVTWDVPNVPSLAGIEVFAQALIVHWPFELRLTNVTADRVH